jgi:hypothetical protein
MTIIVHTQIFWDQNLALTRKIFIQDYQIDSFIVLNIRISIINIIIIIL